MIFIQKLQYNAPNRMYVLRYFIADPFVCLDTEWYIIMHTGTSFWPLSPTMPRDDRTASFERRVHHVTFELNTSIYQRMAAIGKFYMVYIFKIIKHSDYRFDPHYHNEIYFQNV